MTLIDPRVMKTGKLASASAWVEFGSWRRDERQAKNVTGHVPLNKDSPSVCAPNVAPGQGWLTHRAPGLTNGRGPEGWSIFQGWHSGH